MSVLPCLITSRKPDRNPVKEWNAYLEFVERAQNSSGGRRIWSGHPQPVTDRLALGTQRLHLQACAPNVDSQSNRTCAIAREDGAATFEAALAIYPQEPKPLSF